MECPAGDLSGRHPSARRLDRLPLHVPGRRRNRLFASWLAVVEQISDVSSGGYFLIFWMFQNPPDLLFSLIKGMVMATAIVLVGCYYGYTASAEPVRWTATAKSMVLNIVLVHIIGMMERSSSGARTEGSHPGVTR